MCGRFTLRTPAETIADLFGGIPVPRITANYNVAPTQQVATIRQGAEGREFAWLRWGLLPSWAKDARMGARMINARGETVAEKPAFRAAFKRRRCLVLADGFYEWLATPQGKQPMYVTLQDDRVFAMAGLWEVNQRVTEDRIESCTIITTDANPLMARIHDRMPVILPADRYDMWLDSGFQDQQALQQLLVSFPADEMQVRPVSRNVNKVGYNQPDCIEPVATQGNLF
jgi:putative SOS response-associated peptidase YedK